MSEFVVSYIAYLTDMIPFSRLEGTTSSASEAHKYTKTSFLSFSFFST